MTFALVSNLFTKQYSPLIVCWRAWPLEWRNARNIIFIQMTFPSLSGDVTKPRQILAWAADDDLSAPHESRDEFVAQKRVES